MQRTKCIIVPKARQFFRFSDVLMLLWAEGTKLFGFLLFHSLKIGRESMTPPPIRGGELFIFDRPTSPKRLEKNLPFYESTDHGLNRYKYF